MNAVAPATSPVSLGEATRVFARIGLLSFGGPAGQIALMHRILVDEKRWLDQAKALKPAPAGWMIESSETQIANLRKLIDAARVKGIPLQAASSMADHQ